MARCHGRRPIRWKNARDSLKTGCDAGAATNKAALCRLYGISRRTGYKWLERFRQGGWPELEDRSHAAHRQPGRIPGSVERRVIEARRQHPMGAEEAQGLAGVERVDKLASGVDDRRRAEASRTRSRAQADAATGRSGTQSKRPTTSGRSTTRGSFAPATAWCYPLTVERRI